MHRAMRQESGNLSWCLRYEVGHKGQPGIIPGRLRDSTYMNVHFFTSTQSKKPTKCKFSMACDKAKLTRQTDQAQQSRLHS